MRAIAAFWLLGGSLFVGRAAYFIATDAVGRDEDLIYKLVSSLLMGPLCLAAGYGAIRLRAWGLTLGLGVNAISLLNFPFGTLLGAIGLFAFWHVISRTESQSPRSAA